MTRVISIAERNAFSNGAVPIDVPAGQNVEIFPDQTKNPKLTEISSRYIQNTGANPLYYAIGQECSAVAFHGVLVQYAQLDCSSHRLRVCVFSTSGTQVAPLIIYRNDGGRNNVVLPGLP